MKAPLLLIASLSLYAQQVLVIGVDGLSVRGFQQSQSPNLQRLARTGLLSLDARAVLPTVSSPNWGSMLMGAGPAQHGITSNDWRRDKFEISPACKGSQDIFPTVFDVLHTAKPNLKLAAIYDWDGFGRLYETGILAHSAHVPGSSPATAAAKQYWQTEKPNLLFLHLDDVDHAGHEHSWESPQYLAAVARIDTLIGDLLSAVNLNSTTVIIVSDHGGTGTKHGNANNNDLLVPFLVAGPATKNATLAPRLIVYDLAPTLTAIFNVPPHPCWIGKPAVTITKRAP